MNPGEPIPPAVSNETIASQPRINWLRFWIFLFGPTLATIAVILCGLDSGDTAPTIAFFGGGISAIACGVMLARRIGKTTGAQVGLAILFICVFAVVCIGMNCFGCLASGYKLNIH